MIDTESEGALLLFLLLILYMLLTFIFGYRWYAGNSIKAVEVYNHKY